MADFFELIMYANGTSFPSGGTLRTLRVVISASVLAGVASQVVVRFQHIAGHAGWTTDEAWIGLRASSGDSYDADPATMVRLTMGGSTTLAIMDTSVDSDPVPLAVDGTRDVIFTMYPRLTGYRQLAGSPSGTTRVYKYNVNEAAVADVTGYVSTAYLPGIRGLLGAVPMLRRRAPVDQHYGLYADHPLLRLGQGWFVLEDSVLGLLDEPWSLRLGADLREPWTDAPVRQARLLQPWQQAGALAWALGQQWRDAVPLAAGLAQGWDILAPLAAGLVQPWAVAADAALVGPLAQGWDLRDVVPLSTDLAQPWTIGTDPALLRYTLTVTIDGHAVQADSLTLEADLDQDALHATISLGTLADYQRCRDLAPVVVRVAINGGAAEEYHLVQTSARIDERHGETRYEVQAESALVLLGAPYAEPVSVEEYTGAASVVAATLCAPLSLAWQTVDWTLPSGALVAAGETPLELLKRLAAAVGAVVQARPDGSVRVAPEYPISLPAWPTATPDLVWIETERSEQVAGQPERRAGYNKYLIGETLTAADSLRLEEETISETVKIVRGYQVPWTGLFGLVHTGGSWVQVEDLGIETRQETETVEIVAGEGRVRCPIQSRDSVRWLHTTLGALTVSEDGTVRADVAGQSLCEVTYTTRCRKWRVRDSRNEQLQLVAEI